MLVATNKLSKRSPAINLYEEEFFKFDCTSSFSFQMITFWKSKNKILGCSHIYT